MFEFSINSPIIFAMVAMVIGVVIAQSVFFLAKAYKRGLELGMEKSVLNDTIKRSAIFTIAPAVAIFMGVVSLVDMLGVALPWLRLSIIGAVTYELPAAEQALAALGVDRVSNATQYVTIAFVMTFGIAISFRYKISKQKQTEILKFNQKYKDVEDKSSLENQRQDLLNTL